MNLCILENDDLDPATVVTHIGYGAMFERLFRAAGASHWKFDIFSAIRGQYPDSFAPYDAVLLTGSKEDSFSQEAWVLELRRQVSLLLNQKKKLLGVCFGHQLIALCLGAKVGRSPQGWGVGRMVYDWHAADWSLPFGRQQLALLASHQDQVLELPNDAVLLASNAHCPIAAYTVNDVIFCVQGHPEFEASYSAFLLNKRRPSLGEAHYASAIQSLQHEHDGLAMARLMIAFIEAKTP